MQPALQTRRLIVKLKAAALALAAPAEAEEEVAAAMQLNSRAIRPAYSIVKPEIWKQSVYVCKNKVSTQKLYKINFGRLFCLFINRLTPYKRITLTSVS